MEVTMTAHHRAVCRIGQTFAALLLLFLHPGRAASDEARWMQSMNAGAKYHQEAKYTEAEKAYLIALQEAEHFLNQSLRLSMSLNNLAFLYYDQGRYSEAEPLYLRALNLREQCLGPEHSEVGLTLNNLADLYRTQALYIKAEPLYLRALAILEKAL